MTEVVQEQSPDREEMNDEVNLITDKSLDRPETQQSGAVTTEYRRPTSYHRRYISKPIRVKQDRQPRNIALRTVNS